MRKELIATFLESITNQDTLYLAPVYYAGGTVDASVTSEDIARNLTERKLRVIAFSSRKEAIHQLTRNVRPGDCILSMGARDPTLQSFAREIYRAFS